MFSQASVILFGGEGYAWSQVPSGVGWGGMSRRAGMFREWVYQRMGVGIPEGVYQRVGGGYTRVWGSMYTPQTWDLGYPPQY